MLTTDQILLQIENNIDTVLSEDSDLGKELWITLLDEHPADIASLLGRISSDNQKNLIEKLPSGLAAEVLEKSSESVAADILVEIDLDDAANILEKIPAFKILDIFEELTDENFKKYLKLLQKKLRSKVLSLLHFEQESAGRMMNSEVLTFFEDFTIKQSINILQRISPKQEHVLESIYITSRENQLLGHIHIKELVLNKPEVLLSKIMHENELLLHAEDDQELAANQMKHYGLPIAPVVDDKNHFLGVVTADEIFEIIQEEASEDVYKMSGISAVSVDHSYFHTSFWQLIWQRSPWLVALLILQSVSSIIMHQYQEILDTNIILSFFLTMLIGTGGNAGNQSGAVVIRGLTTGEITRKNGIKVLFREFGVSIVMAAILSILSFARVYVTPDADVIKAIAISASLFLIVIVSMMIGTFLPLLLERFNFDPAHSAAPFLSTLMDIIGILIYFLVCSQILS